MAVGKFQPFIKNDTIWAMDTETGQLFKYSKDITEGRQLEGWQVAYALHSKIHASEVEPLEVKVVE